MLIQASNGDQQGDPVGFNDSYIAMPSRSPS
jgi:hypothetical protein